MATKKKVVIEDRRQETDEAAEVTKDQLLALGAEMNTLLFPGEEVDFTEMDEDGILEQIKADAGSIDPGDQFSDESKATLAAIGIDVEWIVAKQSVGEVAVKGKSKKEAKAPAEPKAEKKEKVEREIDKWGFRPDCLKSQVMDMINDGNGDIKKLQEKFKGQVAYAIGESILRKGICIINENGVLKIK